ncbi:helix-turn-helix transcriptional regulator [Streptomyces sp. UNOC14_S4]|uniref:helix-turn-helix domain-containing protein n=1 Tax=Streptomyces sp. UNOC14_S4 TaxID=2872340 RepID=UPI001E3EA4D7|nr:helix-turn-helix transcriptional regulator [Streptomyces sp. UNOC14_S4]MCC3771954.1 helix-turn-helix domain-containing protein [Streptomyces sp. UNOC14_S4]
MSEPRPSVRRRRLATLLTRLREEAGKTPEEAAERIGCHRSRISRIENARLGLSLGELRDLLTFYGVDDPRYVDELCSLARRGNERGWVQRLGVAMPSYADYIDYEQTASYIRSYQPMLVAGLLQTADYARALFRASPVRMPPHRVDELVTVRMQRQEVLAGGRAPHVCVIEGEGALRGQVGGPKVMQAQLEHLQAMAEAVDLQVLPFRAGAHAGVMGSFVLFSFPTPAFSDVVCIEHRTGTLYLETPEETDVYTLTFDSLRSAALSPSESLDLITRIKQEL